MIKVFSSKIYRLQFFDINFDIDGLCMMVYNSLTFKQIKQKYNVHIDFLGLTLISLRWS